MGSSPKETYAGRQYEMMRSLQPSLMQPTFNLQDTLQKAMSGIDSETALGTSAMSANIGQQLAGAGVPGGQPKVESYITALSPMWASAAKEKGLLTSDLAKFAATNQMDARQLLMSLFGQENSIIAQMKDSTDTGDVLGGLTTIGKIALPIILALTGNPLAAAVTGGVNAATSAHGPV